jgi:hypothetical protein
MIIVKSGTDKFRRDSMSGTKIAMGASRTVRSANKLKKFRLLNWLFWLCWLGLPVMIGIAYWSMVNNVPWAIANATPEEAKCLRIFPDPSNLSLDGRILFWSTFAFDFSIYFAILWVLHKMVRKFMSGQIFVSDTLAGLKSLGIILMIWPFLAASVGYASHATLKAWQEFPAWWPLSFNVDFGVVAMGVFLLALRVVIEHAIDIKSDNELTI